MNRKAEESSQDCSLQEEIPLIRVRMHIRAIIPSFQAIYYATSCKFTALIPVVRCQPFACLLQKLPALVGTWNPTWCMDLDKSTNLSQFRCLYLKNNLAKGFSKTIEFWTKCCWISGNEQRFVKFLWWNISVRCALSELTNIRKKNPLNSEIYSAKATQIWWAFEAQFSPSRHDPPTFHPFARRAFNACARGKRCTRTRNIN